MAWLLSNSAIALAVALVATLFAVLVWEHQRPWQPAQAQDPTRTTANYGLLLLAQAQGYIVVPASAALAAWLAGLRGVGLIERAGWPLWAEAALALLLTDALAWAAHWAMHHVPWFWRFHRVHHSDLDFDSSLAFRFHPLETALQALLAAALAAALGLSVAAVTLAGLLGAMHNVFVHANACLPPRLQAGLGLLMVTPEWHRVHHSATVDESMHNFGIVLPWWDHLAGTALPPRPVTRFGVDGLRERRRLGLLRLLFLPFVKA